MGRISTVVALVRRDGDSCCYCGRRLARGATDAKDRPQVEHVVPRSCGGPNTLSNYRLACPTCNVRKGGRTPAEWYLHLLGRSELWKAPRLRSFLLDHTPEADWSYGPPATDYQMHGPVPVPPRQSVGPVELGESLMDVFTQMETGHGLTPG